MACRLRPSSTLAGIGRHVDAFAAAALNGTSLDISLDNLAGAQARAVEAVVSTGTRLIEGDMRKLLAVRGTNDLLTSLFTSFSYLDAVTHRAVLRGWASG